MNKVILNGRLCTIPKISILTIEGNNISVCKFTMAVVDSVFDLVEGSDSDIIPDYFECIAFDRAACNICDNFERGAKILISGKVKNFIFQDFSHTSHCTNVVVVDTIEFGDTSSAVSRNSRNEALNLSIVSDLKQMDRNFKLICEAGFLVLDEEDYFNIANNIFRRCV